LDEDGNEMDGTDYENDYAEMEKLPVDIPQYDVDEMCYDSPLAPNKKTFTYIPNHL
jgi:hypothetical protein